MINEEVLRLQRGFQVQPWVLSFEFWLSVVGAILLILAFLAPFFILYRLHKSTKEKEGKEKKWHQKQPLSLQKFQRVRK